MSTSAKLLREYIDIIEGMNDLNEINNMQKMSQQEAGYVPRATGTSRCGTCEHFVQPNGCQIVTGTISSMGWCRYYDDNDMNEKWGTETTVSPSERGKYKGKSIEELRKAYNALKKSGPHRKGSPEFGRMRELAFAIRAKTGWGGVD